MKPFDNEIQAFTGELKFFAKNTFKDENRENERKRLISRYEKIQKFPILEISQRVWDNMIKALEDAALI